MNNKEIEVQLKVKSVPALQKKLVSLGFKYQDDFDLQDIYFSQNGKFDESKAYLRIRKTNTDTEMTFKRNLNKNKILIRKEINLKIDSADNAIKFLDEMGMKKIISRKVIGKTYKKNDVIFEFIKMLQPKVFEYAEIECIDRRKIDRVLAQIADEVTIISQKDFPKLF